MAISNRGLAEAPDKWPPRLGARPLKLAIRSQLENALAKEILSGRFAAKDTIRVDAVNGKFSFEKTAQAAEFDCGEG